MIKQLTITLLLTFLGSIALASDGAVPFGTVISQLANLGLLVGILYFSQRKMIAQAFKEKKESFLKSVAAASDSKKDAEQKLKEVTKRVSDIQSTFKGQLDKAEQNAEEAYRIQLADAKNEAVRLKSMAEISLDFERQKQVENLRVEAFCKSAGLAKKNLEKTLTPEQLKVWNKKFASHQEGAH